MTKVFLVLWMHFAGGPFEQPQRVEMPNEEVCQAVLKEKLATAHNDRETQESVVTYMAGCLIDHNGGKPA